MATTTKNMQVTAGNANASVTAQVTDSMPGVPCPGPAGYTYTGLRYVPIFADPIEWNSANSYEALTIVVHEGNSYTSKQAVPVGIDILNETFWALTGNYNAQVEQYRQEVKSYENTVKSFDGRITTVENEVVDIQNDIEALKDDILIIGDSWAENYSLRKRKTWTYYLQSYIKAPIHNYAAGGSKVVGTSPIPGLNGNFAGQVDQAIADTSYDHGNVGTVVIMGGVNDFRSKDTASNVANAFIGHINRLHNAFPKSRIIVVLNHQCLITQALVNYCNSIKYLIQPYCECMTTFGWLEFPKHYENDYIHPTQDANGGAIVLMQNMLTIMAGGTINYAHTVANLNIGDSEGNTFVLDFIYDVNDASGFITPHINLSCTTNVSVKNNKVFSFVVNRDGTISDASSGGTGWKLNGGYIWSPFAMPILTSPMMVPLNWMPTTTSNDSHHIAHVRTNGITTDSNQMGLSYTINLNYSNLDETDITKNRPFSKTFGYCTPQGSFGNIVS